MNGGAGGDGDWKLVYLLLLLWRATEGLGDKGAEEGEKIGRWRWRHSCGYDTVCGGKS